MPATSLGTSSPTERTRRDRCPGVLRPWLADDGALVRLRLPGGEVTVAELTALAEVATAHGDGRVRLTSRANLQLRGLPRLDAATTAESAQVTTATPATELTPEAESALLETGLVPAPAHERVRNIMVSPLTGIASGLADLRPLVPALDAAICAEPQLTALPGRFLFVLDDGRGDLMSRRRDLGLVAVDAEHGQLLLGSHDHGPVLPLPEVPAALTALAHAFLAVRGNGEDAPWHVDELPPATAGARAWHHPFEMRAAAPGAYPQTPNEPLPAGMVAPGWVHHRCPHGLDRAAVAALTAGLAGETRLVVTPWRGVLTPDSRSTG